LKTLPARILMMKTEHGNLCRHLRHRETGLRSVVGENESGWMCKRFVERGRIGHRDLVGHYGCVNAVEFSPDGMSLASGGDDKRLMVNKSNLRFSSFGSISLFTFQLWRVHEKIPKPVVLAGPHASNIFSIDFDPDGTKIYSGGNDECVILRDIESGSNASPLGVYLHDDPVYGISACPDLGSVFASAVSDGKVRLFDTRSDVGREGSLVLATYGDGGDPFHSVQFNPVEPRLVVTSNNKQGIALWDVRKPRQCAMTYGTESAMSARFNSAGTRIIGLRKKLPPVLYRIDSPVKECEFDAGGYYNSCTMKTCTFAGVDDELVVSGSDNFSVYVWRIDAEGKRARGGGHKVIGTADMVLKGHRSIVNQVRFSKALGLLASSGVEKMVKLWGSLDDKEALNPERKESIKREEYIRLVLNSWATEDCDAERTEENRGMLAFFDSLLQREAESSHGLLTTSSDTDPEIAMPVDFDRWSDVDTESAAAASSSSSAGDNVRGANDSDSAQPSTGRRASKLLASHLIGKLRKKMKFKRLRQNKPTLKCVDRCLTRAKSVIKMSNGGFESAFAEALAYSSSSDVDLSDSVNDPSPGPSIGPSIPGVFVSRERIEESARMKSDILTALAAEATSSSPSAASSDNEGGQRNSDKKAATNLAAKAESVTFKSRAAKGRRNYRARRRCTAAADRSSSSSSSEDD
jgi:WD40 repeat protein